MVSCLEVSDCTGPDNASADRCLEALLAWRPYRGNSRRARLAWQDTRDRDSDDLRPSMSSISGLAELPRIFSISSGSLLRRMFLTLDAALAGLRASVTPSDTERCHVTGIDLTPEYRRNHGQRAVRLGGSRSTHSSASRQCACDAVCQNSFDGAYMLHVGMNIEDKEKLAVEVAECAAAGLHLRNLRRDANGAWRPHLPGSLGNDRPTRAPWQNRSGTRRRAEGGVRHHRRTQPA